MRYYFLERDEVGRTIICKRECVFFFLEWNVIFKILYVQKIEVNYFFE